MATLYRFSFEHEIVPNGVTIANGDIWSGFGRFGSTTTALVATSSQAAVTASLPADTQGVRGSYYTKYSRSGSYPSNLVSVGPFDFNLIDSTTTQIKVNGSEVATQDVTEVVDNRWNLVRFKVDLNNGGASSTGSIEFNGINLEWKGATGVPSASQVIVRAINGSISSLDDVGINDSSGSLDNDVPASIRGMIGGMMGDGDIQNWQQNVASLPPTKVPLDYQGGLLYIPKNDLVLTQNVYDPAATSYSTFTTINAQTSVTRSVWSSSFGGGNQFVVQATVYSPYDHKVYLYGSSGTTLKYAVYDPNLDAVVSTGSYAASDTQAGYNYQTGKCVISATYSEINSKIMILSSIISPEEQANIPNSQASLRINSQASLRITAHNLSDNTLSFGLYPFVTYFTEGSGLSIPRGKIFYNVLDRRIYIFSDMFSVSGKIYVVNPTTLFLSTTTQPKWSGGAPSLPTSSFAISEINNHLFLATYTFGDSGPGEIWKLDMGTMTGSKVIDQYNPYSGTYTTRLSYIPGRNAILATGAAISYLINPFKAQEGLTNSATIIEYLPQIFNALDSVYCTRNAAVFISTQDAVFNFQGSMEASVVNALMNLDSLKAGATASGDICTIQIAKPSGSFTSNFRYEGMNVRIDNASSLATSSLILGVRDGGNNIPLSSSVTTWGNSQQTAVRSIFTYQNSGSAKWTEAQFKDLQFYMEAGPEL